MELPDVTTLQQMTLMLGVPAYVVKKLFDPTLERYGDEIRDWMDPVKREERRRAVVMDAAAKLNEKGIEAQPVPGRILMPILNFCSWEDEPELRSKWSSLLASAATSDAMVLPGFAEILRQLKPTHARILDYMFKTLLAEAGQPGGTDGAFTRDQLARECRIDHPDEIYVLIPDLHRLGLVEGVIPSEDQPLSTRQLQELLRRQGDGEQIELSSLGIYFMTACS